MSTRMLSLIPAVFLAAAPVLAQDAPPPAAEGGLFGGNFLFVMVAMIAIIYFVMIRPEKKRQQERQKMLSSLKKGDKVVTIGGIMGTITAVKDSSYLVKTGDGSAVLEFTKSAVQTVVTNDGGDANGKDVKTLNEQIGNAAEGSR